MPAEVKEGRLVERDAELFALREVIADVASHGSGRAVLVEGEAGIGKTSLLGALRGIAARAGYTVAGTTCGELETDLAFGAARDLFRPLWPDVAAELPAPAASAAATFDALHWRCVELAAAAPLLLVVDDVQWCDASSARFLSYHLRRLRDIPVVCAIGRRAGGAAPVAEAATQEAKAVILRPKPLSGQATRALIRRGDPDAPDEACDAVQRAAAGNPFLILALAQAAADAGSTTVPNRLDKGAATRSILTRLGRLGEDTLQIANAIAVLGSESLVRRAALLAELSESRAAAAIDALVDHGFLTASPVAFAHPVVRTAVVGEIAPAALVSLHAHAARVLRADGAHDDVVSAHLLDADPGQGDWARNTLLSTGAAAADRGDFALALRCADHVLAARAGDRREDALVLRGLALCGAGADDAAARDAMAEVTPAGRARLAIPVAWRMAISGQAVEAGALLDEVRAEVEDRETQLHLAAAGARVAAIAGDRTGMTRRLDETDARSLAGATIAERAVLQEATFARLGEAKDARTLVALARRAAGDWRTGEPAVLPAFALAVAGEFAESLTAHDQVLAHARRKFGETFAGTIIANRAVLFVRCGRIIEAHSDAELAVDLSERDPGASDAGGWTRAILALTTALRGDPVQAARLLEAVPDRGPTDMPSAIVHEQRARIIALCGRPQEAVERFRVLGAWLERQGITNPAWWSWRSAAARILVGIGEREEARHLAADELRDARAFGAPHAVAISLIAAGMAEDGESGIALLREAVDLLAASQAAGAYGDALLAFGSALRRAGAPKDARQPLRAALDVADRGGIGLLAAAAEAELRATGARPRRRALHGAGALTPAEYRVARLAADGLTNTQIARSLYLTPKTIETHLGRTYAKLGINGRDALAGALGALAG